MSIWSSSSSDAPTWWPMAARNVKHMPPPITRLSTTSSSALMTPNLSDTFDPPRIEMNGRRGSLRTSSRTSTSRSNSRPAADGKVRSGPTMEAWARCEAPKASFT